MKKYRIKEIDGTFYPQERYFLFFWAKLKLYSRSARDWFFTSAQAGIFDSTVSYRIAKDGWGVTYWVSPEFNTLKRAKLFIEKYEKFLEEERQKRKSKYYY